MIDKPLLDEIRRAVSMSSVVGRVIAPSKKDRNGDVQFLCMFHNERSPSFYAVDKKQFGHCFGCGWSGDIFKFTQEYYGKTFPEAVTILAQDAGIEIPGALRAQAVADRDSGAGAGERRDKFAGDADAARQAAQKARKIRDIWQNTVAAPGTLVEVYLRHRKYRGEIPPDIRYNQLVWYNPSENEDQKLLRRMPAMVTRIVGLDGRGQALHLTYLALDGRGKAGVLVPKKTRGSVRGGAIWLAGSTVEGGAVQCEPVVLLVEGIESGLRIRDALWDPDVGACHIDGEIISLCCTVSLGNMATVALPARVREIVVCAENDMLRPDLDADRVRSDPRERIIAAQEAHRRQGRMVRVAQAPIGLDFDDLASR